MTASVEGRRLRARLERGVADGWFTGAQAYASLRGRVGIDFAIGCSRPDVSMTPATIVEWASATKAITCCAAALLWERGVIGLDDRVAAYLPEFGVAGKGDVTIRHLLTHTGGLTDATEIGMPFGEAVAAVCAAPLQQGWVPGRDFGYNSVGMWILAAVVSRVSGRDFAAFVQDEIFTPLGLHRSWLRMPPESYDRYRDEIAMIPGHAHSGTREWVTWGRPTGGCHGPVRELGMFYAALIEHRVLSAPVLEAMTARHLSGVREPAAAEPIFVDRGLGFALASTYPGHGYGPRASRRTFGHGGGSWCIAFADPEIGLAAALYWNGRLDPLTQAQLVPDLLDVLWRDLNLVGSDSFGAGAG